MSDTNSSNEGYEAILREHAKLRELLVELKQLLFDRTAAFSDVAARLAALQSLVEGHFRTEEDSGCFGDLVNHAPRVSDKVEALIVEHTDLSAAISSLVQRAAKAEGSDEDWNETDAKFHDFTEQLMQHETVENELLQEVFTEDIGSKD